MTKSKKWAGRLLALLLSVMIIAGLLPTAAVAAGTTGSAADAVVTLTVSNKGVLAAANDGSVMANRKVTVKDINSDGYLTFDEALVAAHAEYNSEAGYSGGPYVSKLWGVETSNCLFFINDVGLSESVDSDTVKAGDRLVASINADDKYYGDWYAAFDKVSATAAVGEDITLTLKGHLGMAGGEEATDTGLSGISVGVMSEGGFSAIEGKVTDGDGKVTVSFDTAGTYYITASGTVEDTVTDWNLMNMSTADNPVFGKMDFNTYETSMAYTENDYGDGPYPADEVKWVDFETWKDNQDSYHTLHSNQLITDCPIIAPVCVVTVEKAEGTANFEEVYKDTGDYLVSLGVPGVGSTGGEWIVIGLARSDREVADGYYEAVLQFVQEEINDAEQLHRVKSTENSRIILALTALGLDVTDVGGHDLLQGLMDMDYVTAQGINGPIWALIAFDSAGYEIPSASEGSEQVTRENLIAYILERQLDDGGWALSGSAADPDMTGMALQALAPYYDSNSEVKAAVDEALDCLSEVQRDDGGFASWGTVNAESCAQVIVALTALGINPDSDPRFIKNDCSALDALLAFAVDGGGFRHTATGNVNGMATEQGYYALVAYDRFLNGRTSLYDMSDVIGGTEEPPVTDYEDVYKATGDYLASLGTPGVGSTGGEWRVLGLARSDREVSDEYYSAVVKFVRENINEKEQLDAAKSTENVRVILALTSLGFDVTDVDGHNLLQGLTDMNYLKAQGINGPIWALIAFDSHDYEIPEAAGADQVTREKLVDYILQTQLNDGGWALGGNEADPDMTAIALQALAPYYDISDVKTAVDEALNCLSVLQQPDGGYMSAGIANAESCAQVVVALTALGIDPDSDARFIKNGNSVLDALLTFAMAEGGFKHTTTSSLVNGTATEQGYYALVAYDRFINEKTSLYDMSDVEVKTEEPPVPEDKDITLTDVEGIGVTVTGKESILNGLELEANLRTSGDLYEKVKEALKDGKFTLYDLYLLENNLEVQPEGTITVSIPVPEDYDGAKCKVYFVNVDGSVTEITAVLQDGKLVFETEKMGAFAIYQPAAVDTGDPDGNGDGITNPGDGNNDGTTDVPQTGDSSHVVLWFTVSLLSLAAMTLLGKRKKTVK